MAKKREFIREAVSKISTWVLASINWIGLQLHISSKYAAGAGMLVLWGVGMTLIQVDEYACAIACWILSALVLISKAVHLEGSSERPAWMKFKRFGYGIGAIVFLCISIVWTQAKRGDRPWTNFIHRINLPNSAGLTPSQPIDLPNRSSMPGLSLESMVAIRRTGLERRQYLYDSGVADGERISEYISQGEIFTFSMTDAHGEQHSVVVPLGSAGIPYDEWNFLICELGIGVDSSFMRVVVNGKELAYSNFPERLPIKLHPEAKTYVGNSIKKNEGASFMIGFLAIYSSTLTSTEIKQNETVLKKTRPDLHHLAPFTLMHEENEQNLKVP